MERVNLSFIGYPDYDALSDGNIYSHKTNKVMRGWLCPQGYHMVVLRGKVPDGRIFRTHRLIARAFLDGYEEGLHVNHKNKPKTDNRPENLEWVTPKENLEYAYKTGEHRGKGFKGKSIETVAEARTGVLSEEDAHVICSMLEEGYRSSDISRFTGFPVRRINFIRTGEHKKHISAQYSFSKSEKETRLPPEKVHVVCEKLQQGKGVLEVARELDLNRKCVGNIKNGITFKEISKLYNLN